MQLEDIFEKKVDYKESILLKNGYTANFLTFKDRPFKGANLIVTEGLNNFSTCSKDILFIYSGFDVSLNKEITSLMATYLDFHYFKFDCHIEVDDILYVPNFQLISGFFFQAFYTLNPVYLEGLLDYDKYMWLLPIFKKEYDFICKNGSNSFQEILEEKNTDLSDLDRSSIV